MIKNQKGFIHLLLLLFVSLILFSGVGYYAYKNGQIKIKSSDTPLNSPTPKVDPTNDWKSYTNDKYKYQLEIPITWTIDDTGTVPDKMVAHFYDKNSMDKLGLDNNFRIVSNIGESEEVYLKGARASSFSREVVDNFKLGNLNGKMIVYTNMGDVFSHFFIFQNNNIKYSIEFHSKIKFGLLYDQILSTFKFLDSESDQVTITGNQCLEFLTNSDIVNTNLTSDTGLVTGNVYYPSQGLPKDIKVCAFEVNKKIRYCSPTILNSSPTYQLILSEGKYYIYTLSNKNMIGIGAPNIVNDYQIIKDSSGREIGRAPLLINVTKGATLDNVGVGDDILMEDELICRDIK